MEHFIAEMLQGGTYVPIIGAELRKYLKLTLVLIKMTFTLRCFVNHVTEQCPGEVYLYSHAAAN